MMLDETEKGGMMAGYNTGEVAPAAWMCVLPAATSLLQSVLTPCDISVATATETYTDVETVR